MEKISLQKLILVAKKQEQACSEAYTKFRAEHKDDNSLEVKVREVRLLTELKDAMALVALVTCESYFNEICSEYGVY